VLKKPTLHWIAAKTQDSVKHLITGRYRLKIHSGTMFDYGGDVILLWDF
jgi:hypothetical protein